MRHASSQKQRKLIALCSSSRPSLRGAVAESMEVAVVPRERGRCRSPSTKTVRRACATGSSSRRLCRAACSASRSNPAIRWFAARRPRAHHAGRVSAARSAHAKESSRPRSRPLRRPSARRERSGNARRRRSTARARRCARQQELMKAGAIAADRPRGRETALATAEDGLRAAEFTERRAEYELQLARAACQPRRLGRSVDVLCLPIDGTVLKRLRESEGVVPVGEPLLEIGEPERMEIVADLLSTDAVRVSPGAEVLIEQWGGTPLHGRCGGSNRRGS